MQLNIKEFLEEAEITEEFYPGKRLVKSLRQTGEYKSHCVVLDWRDPDKIRIEIKAGLSGRSLEPKELKYYPVSFQAPTYVDIEVVNDNNDDSHEDEDEEKSSSGGKGGGSKGQKKKSLKDLTSAMSNAFDDAMQGHVPDLGKVVEMMVMGKEIAAEAFKDVMAKLTTQLEHGKIIATDLVAAASKIVTKYTPPSFMKPTGDEKATYKYDREKNADIGFTRQSGPA